MQAEEDAKKICVVHRETEHIDMYINENEMVEVDVCVKKYGYSLVQYNHFEEDMQKVLDNK